MYKAIENGKVVGINDTGVFRLMNYDSIDEDTEHSVSDYMQVNGEYVLTSSDEAIEQKKADVRAVRNRYLEQTDKYMITDYPISDDERELYRQYRTYLRDYTLTDNWWESEPQKFEEWNKPKEPDPSETQKEAGI